MPPAVQQAPRPALLLHYQTRHSARRSPTPRTLVPPRQIPPALALRQAGDCKTKRAMDRLCGNTHRGQTTGGKTLSTPPTHVLGLVDVTYRLTATTTAVLLLSWTGCRCDQTYTADGKWTDLFLHLRVGYDAVPRQLQNLATSPFSWLPHHFDPSDSWSTCTKRLKSVYIVATRPVTYSQHMSQLQFERCQHI